MRDALLPLILFALAGSVSPGPNNIMVTASGSAFGLARTLPHILGITIGFSIMIVAFGLGLAGIFRAYPALHWWLRIAGSIYLLYLAYRIARAGDPGANEAVRRPVTFVEAALFQWVNPKAWTLALGVVTAFTSVGGDLALELSVIAGIFALTTFPSLIVCVCSELRSANSFPRRARCGPPISPWRAWWRSR